MKIKNGKELVGKYLNGKSCSEIYKIVSNKAVLIWQAIRSCFGKGFWNNLKPWSNTDGWHNG